MTTILVTGANGQLGQTLKQVLPHASYADRERLDLASLDKTEDYFKLHGVFDVIINLAAYTLVDKAEAEKNLATQVNALAPGRLAKYAKRFIHVSTDYVFDGTSEIPYKETDITAPINHYGLTKRHGEENALKANSNTVVVRTSWLYSQYSGNFVTKMLELAKTRQELKIVDDQTGSPTYALDLAEVLVAILRHTDMQGIYHYSNEGKCTWYEFAKEIFRLKKIPIRVLPIPSSEFPTPAKRPTFSLLDKSKIKNALQTSVPDWRLSLAKCMESL